MAPFLLMAASCMGGARHRVDTPPVASSCNDPAEAQRFAVCRLAKTQDSCLAAGGEWRVVAPLPQFECVCQTGQDGCACRSANQCLVACTAPLKQREEGGKIGEVSADCRGVKQGTCATFWPANGCRCWFDEQGHVRMYCTE